MVIEADEDGWRAFCPELEKIGGSTWGYTKAEARKNIHEVLEMIVEEFVDEGQPVPVIGAVDNSPDEVVAVTL